MSIEEKKAAELAAQKATQEAKNKSDSDKSKEGEEGDDADEDEEEEEPSEDPKVIKLQSQLKKAREDAAKHRISVRELKEKQEKTDKALAALNGKEEKTDPLEELKRSSEAKLKRSLLKGELAVVAKDAHNPGLLMSAFSKNFEDVEVDVEGETVDTESLTEKVQELRESHPYLFKKEEVDEEVELEEKKDEKKKKGGTLPPDRGGKPKGGTNHKDIWQNLIKQGKKPEAQAYYREHKSDILARM